MFSQALEEALLKIFAMPKATFAKPRDPAKEQNIIFINVTKSIVRAKEKICKARVEGEITIFAPSMKMPFGFFEKQLYKSEAEDTEPFWFYNMTENSLMTGDIVERKASFVYFYNSEYDPEHGSLTSVEF